MELAKTLLRIWKLRVWVGFGVVLAVGAAAAALKMGGSQVYSSASTQMVVDAPHTALGDTREDLTPYLTRAYVYARLMTTPEALLYIGRAAGVPGNLIAASGPTELAGPQATHAPTATAGTALHSAATYKLNFLQNPDLPTVDVYAEAPTTAQAIKLANGAVTGFAAYLKSLDGQSAVPAAQRVTIRQAGSATGGVVDPSQSKSLAAIIFLVVLALWVALVLFVSNVRAQLRLARENQRSLDAEPGYLADAFAPQADAAGLDFSQPFDDGDLPDFVFEGTVPGHGAGDHGQAHEREWARGVAEGASGTGDSADRS